jgi:hypothetical protein
MEYVNVFVWVYMGQKSSTARGIWGLGDLHLFLRVSSLFYHRLQECGGDTRGVLFSTNEV